MENRYGPGIAQAIIGEIKKVEQGTGEPDILTVKALSEATEIFRTESREALKTLRANEDIEDSVMNCINFTRAQQARELNRLFSLYMLSQKLFYHLYRVGMEAYRVEVPQHHPLVRDPNKPVMRNAA